MGCISKKGRPFNCKLNPVNDRKAMKITITVKQAQQYNLMLHVLRKIHKEYMSPDRMRKHPDAEFHGFEEYLSMAYENIQEEARVVSYKLQDIKIPSMIYAIDHNELKSAKDEELNQIKGLLDPDSKSEQAN